MQHWIEGDPLRFDKEREFMFAHTRAVLCVERGQLVWYEDLRSSATGQAYRLAITYPATFPHAPPAAHVVWPDVAGAPHRFSNGALCLWSTPSVGAGVKTTALMVRNRAVVWFLAYEGWRRTGQWLAPQH